MYIKNLEENLKKDVATLKNVIEEKKNNLKKLDGILSKIDNKHAEYIIEKDIDDNDNIVTFEFALIQIKSALKFLKNENFWYGIEEVTIDKVKELTNSFDDYIKNDYSQYEYYTLLEMLYNLKEYPFDSVRYIQELENNYSLEKRELFIDITEEIKKHNKELEQVLNNIFINLLKFNHEVNKKNPLYY